ncbi:hypothetical protein JHK87_004341 [Glycine soja]|nr:hypothetical protein JHK87_004341 [Glycine soja]
MAMKYARVGFGFPVPNSTKGGVSLDSDLKRCCYEGCLSIRQHSMSSTFSGIDRPLASLYDLKSRKFHLVTYQSMSSMGDQANFSISKNEVYTPVNVTSSTNNALNNKALNTRVGHICLNVETRWNSTYLILDVALKPKKTFQKSEFYDPQYVDDLGKGIGLPSNEDWEYVEAILPFLTIVY